jgi:hypothetical protein
VSLFLPDFPVCMQHILQGSTKKKKKKEEEKKKKMEPS